MGEVIHWILYYDSWPGTSRIALVPCELFGDGLSRQCTVTRKQNTKTKSLTFAEA